MRAPLLASALSALALAGCAEMFGTDDPHQPGSELGVFHVSAIQQTNSCGAGALGSTASWEFDIELARGEQGQLFWGNGAQIIVGEIAADGRSFTINSVVEVDMRTEETLGMPPCSLRRDDSATGVLDGKDNDVSGFVGSMSFAFSPTVDSECSDLVPPAEQPTFVTLPCSMSYQLDALRTEAPEGLGGSGGGGGSGGSGGDGGAGG
jgi:hypothetical protein